MNNKDLVLLEITQVNLSHLMLRELTTSKGDVIKYFLPPCGDTLHRYAIYTSNLQNGPDVR